MTAPEGWAAIILAAATLISSLAGLVVAVRSGQKASLTHDLVNGQSVALQQMREDKGFREGVAESNKGSS